MHSETTNVANISLLTDKPTNLTFRQLETWVIWQFPRKKEGGLCGAVRPSLPDHGWYPALIFPQEQRALVYGHQGALFPSPEAASESLAG